MKDCTHCGKCCLGSPCGLARVKLSGRCVALRRLGSKYFCDLILDAHGKERERLIHTLKIGEGCHLWAGSDKEESLGDR